MKPPSAGVLLVVTLAAFSARAIETGSETGPCSLEQASPATIATIDDDFELLLDDGKRVALSGLEFPQDAKLRAAALARLRAWLAGEDVFLAPLSSHPDRWSRLPAYIFAPQTSAPEAPLVSVAAALLNEGLARFRPDSAASACAKIYLAAEAPAREGRLGVWSADPVIDLDALAPSALAALARRRGLVVVAGTIRSVGETKTMFYLNMGGRRGRDFALAISKRDAAKIERASVAPHELTGRHVIARGLIDNARTLLMEIVAPEQLQAMRGDTAR